MTISREKRNAIERKGVPFIVTTLLRVFDITISDITLITDYQTQIKGVDYILSNGLNKITVDSKYHKNIQKKQNTTVYGVDAISIEITNRYGYDGWGISKQKDTDYIIDYIPDTAVYIIDARALRTYLRQNYHMYPIWYSAEGKEQYRGVDIIDLLENNIIVDYTADKCYMTELQEYALMLQQTEDYRNIIETSVHNLQQ